MLFLDRRENSMTSMCCISVMCSVKLKSKKTCQFLIEQRNYGVLDRKEKLQREGESSDVLESRALARGELRPLPCQDNFAGYMGVTVHCTWVSKSTYETHKYRNCSSIFRQKFQSLKVHLSHKDWLQGDSSRCGTACFVPCFLLHSLTRLAEAAESYPETLLAWAACGSGDSKCFTPLENSLVGSLS